jgi:PTS system ascorbate-specific IIC component
MLFISSMLVVGLHYGLGLDGLPLVVVTATLCAAYWTVMPQWTYDAYARHLADGKFTLGHHVHLSVALASEIGRLVGRPEDDADQLDLPEALTLFQDVTINAAITLPVFFFIVGVAVGLPAVRQQAGDQAWWFYLLMRGLRFSAGLTVMLLGIKEFLDALVPAFEGWAERVIPGAIPGLDVPVFFPSSPVGMMLGFLGGAAGMFLVSFVLFVARSALFVFPSLIVAVFEMGTMGVFANERGGWKAALLAGFVGGVLLSAGAFVLQPVTAPLLAGTGAQYGSLDSAYFFGPLMWLLRLLGQMLGVR